MAAVFKQMSAGQLVAKRPTSNTSASATAVKEAPLRHELPRLRRSLRRGPVGTGPMRRGSWPSRRSSTTPGRARVSHELGRSESSFPSSACCRGISHREDEADLRADALSDDWRISMTRRGRPWPTFGPLPPTIRYRSGHAAPSVRRSIDGVCWRKTCISTSTKGTTCFFLSSCARVIILNHNISEDNPVCLLFGRKYNLAKRGRLFFSVPPIRRYGFSCFSKKLRKS